MQNLEVDYIPEDYNEEPVHYCTRCLSLRIRSVTSIKDSEYCDACGYPNVDKCSIQEWEDKYVAKYGHKYLNDY